MEMRHTFTTLRTVIDYDPKTVAKFLFLGQFLSDEQKVSKCWLIGFVRFGNPNNFCFGNDEDMCRSLWFNILNCNTGIILVQNFGGDFPVNNFFKNTLHSKLFCGPGPEGEKPEIFKSGFVFEVDLQQS